MSIPTILMLSGAVICLIAALAKKQFVLAVAFSCFIISGIIAHYPDFLPVPVWASMVFIILFFVLPCVAGILKITRNIPK